MLPWRRSLSLVCGGSARVSTFSRFSSRRLALGSFPLSKNYIRRATLQPQCIDTGKRWLSIPPEASPESGEAGGAGEAPLFEDPRLQILEAALARVQTEGWTEAALAAGATSLGFPGVSHGMFLRGPIELVEYFLEKCNKAWLDELDQRQEELQGLTPRERIRVAIELRLRHIAPMVSYWPEALALGVVPQNLESTAKHIAVLADEFCYRAGKDAVDLAWYKDRAVVAGVYVSTELFFLTDYSEDFQDTWSFLERRLDDMEKLDKSPQSLGDGAHAISTATTAIVSAVSSLLVQPGVLHAVQKVPITGAVSVVLQTLVANLVSMAPAVPSPDGLTPRGTNVQESPYPPPAESDPYETTSTSSGSGSTSSSGGSPVDVGKQGPTFTSHEGRR